ncbi:MAG: receiver component of a two-component response regulator [Puniceicoccaceae bacterium 5H]|nr:MAG: receiver component of a two-component response regulator [Puniceicoccaceae bacterium 5H]
MAIPLLLVDDNNRYAKLLTDYFAPRGFTLERATSGEEGLEKFRAHAPDHFAAVITDITMETRLAGYWMVRRLRRAGYKGTIMVASTAFNEIPIIDLHRALYRGLDVQFLIPKRELKEGRPYFYPLGFFKAPLTEWRPEDA